MRTILKGKTRDETAKKHQQAKRAVGWIGEGEKAQTPSRPVSLTDFFYVFFPTAEPGPRLYLIRSLCFCYFLFRVESMC